MSTYSGHSNTLMLVKYNENGTLYMDITDFLESVSYDHDKFNDMILEKEKDNKVSTTLYTVTLAYAREYKTAIKVTKCGLNLFIF